LLQLLLFTVKFTGCHEIADARGKEREAMIRRWCDELGAANAPARLLGTLTPRLLTMGSSPGTEGEWQQLQVGTILQTGK
jgi:hypothetical protein